MYDKLVPGTVMPYTDVAGGMFSVFRPMITATDGLTLGQVSALTGLEYSTVQNWVKRGFVAHPVQKKYYERQLARILLIAALRDCLKIEQIAALLSAVNGDVEDAGVDIISESRLYDYLCEAVRLLDVDRLSADKVDAAVARVTADYVGPDATAKGRLSAALRVMVLAFMAGCLAREATLGLSALQNT